MSKSFTLGQLTEGIRDRHVGQEASRIQEKWTRTGLLRGLQSHNRENMSRLLENQAAQVLREANTLGSGGSDSGQIDGFSNIAFPIVRRVFGGLVANELVSIQPMSLPSGLLFYLDYTYGSDVGGPADSNSASSTTLEAGTGGSTFTQGQSIYNNPVGSEIRTGSDATGGQYDLVGTTYSKVHTSSAWTTVARARQAHQAGTIAGESLLFSGSFGGAASQAPTHGTVLAVSGADGKLLQFDPQIIKEINEGTNDYTAVVVGLNDADYTDFDVTNAKSFALTIGGTDRLNELHGTTVPGSNIQGGQGVRNVRRLNQVGTLSDANVFTPNPFITPGPTAGGGIIGAALLTIFQGALASTAGLTGRLCMALTSSYAKADSVAAANNSGQGATLVIPSFESDFSNTPQPIIPEIDIKIESIAVTATTRKLRARWSPELAQDLNAYHSMDAEVELTQILSEQIALEIDREILNDLLVEAKGANFFWSRAPGKFINKRSGVAENLASTLSTGPQFTGTVREWYETLVETIIDVANEIHRKTLRGSANFIVVSPEVATIFEASILYKPSIKIDGQGQAAISGIGAEAIGSLSNRFTVYKDPYFPRNKILVGYKGGSYLESGYVYAPYVPLIVTPTIFAPEDFTPRKGVMTRYGKKMVRADFYGTVTCLDMDII
jgi:hypothetical protein